MGRKMRGGEVSAMIRLTEALSGSVISAQVSAAVLVICVPGDNPSAIPTGKVSGMFCVDEIVSPAARVISWRLDTA
jgi:hypothetical protein